MKKIFLTFVAVAAIATSAFAQAGALQFGVKAGVNLSSVSGDVEDVKSKIGFNVGVTVDYGFTDNLFLLSGLELTQKGYKVEEEYSEDYPGASVNVKSTVTSSPLYLQIPIHIAYKLDLGSVKLVPEVGPYVAFGIAGKTKVKTELSSDNQAVLDLIGDTSSEEDGDFFGSEDEGGAKSFDFGIGLGIGAEFGKLGAKIGYDLGLTSLSYNKDFSVKNGNFYLSVGYKF
jgi:hypothetical protein